YYYNRIEAVAALSPFAPADAPQNKLRNEHYGFSLGGPVQKDRTFFFTNYEHQGVEIRKQALATMTSAAYHDAATARWRRCRRPRTRARRCSCCSSSRCR